MDRAEQFIAVVDDPNAEPLEPGHPADPALLAILVHVAFADGMVEEEEFDLLARLAPDRDIGDLLVWISEVSDRPLDARMMREVLQSDEERYNALRFGARMAWSDGEVAPSESMVLMGVAKALELPDDALAEAIQDLGE